jgi:hypothetical protein
MAEAKLLKASGVMGESFEIWLTEWFMANWNQGCDAAEIWAEKLIEDYLDHLQSQIPQ